MNLRLAALLPLCLAMLPFAASAQADARPTYGPMLEGFAYPHDVKRFAVQSQQRALQMAYMDIAPRGQANGRTAVLLHGKNFCGATWEKSIEVLSTAGYRVVVPDQIGFCASSKPRGYQFSFGQLAANTQDLLESLGVQKAVVIGHSMGGMLGTRFALAYPQAVERLVLVNPIGLEDWQAAGVPYASIDAQYATERKTTFDSIKNYQLRYYYNGQWKPEYDHWVQMQAGLYVGAGAEVVALNQAQISDIVFTQPVVHEFGQLRVPTLLMIGGKDRTAPVANRAPAEVAQKLGDYPTLGREAARRIPNAQLVEFPELGHSPQVEGPQQFHSALLRELR